MALTVPASATTVGVDACSVSGGGSAATFTLVTSTMAECFAGNASNSIEATTTVLQMEGWSLYEKLDASSGAANGDFNFDSDTAGNNGSKDGTIFADLSGFTSAFIALKAGNGFGAFLVSVTDTSWDWTSSKNISNVSIWTKGTAPDSNTPPGTVPLPAGGALLLGGLALLTIRRSRS
ncbi:hypothetical protein [Roseobacter cerasinus]|nr:hypothetical protein [Roseobacter cerasinus]